MTDGRIPEGRTVDIRLQRAAVRLPVEADAESLARHADNRNIWINLRDGFPHPYGVDHARAFIQTARASEPPLRFVIDVEGQAGGAIGFMPDADVGRVAAEIGYWLGEPFWGRGIMTEVLGAVTEYAIRTHRLTRVYATPFEWNQASFRVLEKAGYRLEGRLQRSALKDGKIIDQLLYAFVTDQRGVCAGQFSSAEHS
jgi:ribosomal-protein-alanine N-acetyltransferase